jgi:hypothetical protein
MAWQVDIRTALRDHGVRVVTTDGWAARGYNTLDPVAQVNHHTAIAGPCTPSTAAAMIRGRPDLPGPLCNTHGGLDPDVKPVLYLIAGRRARHAGKGSGVVLQEMLANRPPSGDAADRGLVDDTDGNRRLIGHEWQHPGDSSPWPDPLLELVTRTNAAFADVFGWTAARSIHHREWTRRKIDMSWRGDLRGLIHARLTGEDDMTAAELEAVVRRILNEATAQGQRDYAGTVKATLANVQALRNEVKALQTGEGQVDVDALAAKVADLLAARLAQ